ncbi:hypothetical protein JZ751_014976 [Albula glossodonta]|uniref:Uncharacterized protein n=1 Tax=Albula glossodonta TaxID=121402 RepID=A0A8T2MYV0_9TELE|nr:hypothetical protein JZ751_014976 [Albula glossodonta]
MSMSRRSALWHLRRAVCRTCWRPKLWLFPRLTGSSPSTAAREHRLRLRCTECDRMLKELQAAHIVLNKQAETLRKQNDNLKVHQERFINQLEEKKEQVEKLDADLREREREIKGLQQERRQLEEHSRQRDREMEDRGNTIEALRKELSKAEQARKEASIKTQILLGFVYVSTQVTGTGHC